MPKVDPILLEHFFDAGKPAYIEVVAKNYIHLEEDEQMEFNHNTDDGGCIIRISGVPYIECYVPQTNAACFMRFRLLMNIELFSLASRELDSVISYISSYTREIPREEDEQIEVYTHTTEDPAGIYDLLIWVRDTVFDLARPHHKDLDDPYDPSSFKIFCPYGVTLGTIKIDSKCVELIALSKNGCASIEKIEDDGKIRYVAKLSLQFKDLPAEDIKEYLELYHQRKMERKKRMMMKKN